MTRLLAVIGSAALALSAAMLTPPGPPTSVSMPSFVAMYDLIVEGQAAGDVLLEWNDESDWRTVEGERSLDDGTPGMEGASTGGVEAEFRDGVHTRREVDTGTFIHGQVVQDGRLAPGWWFRTMEQVIDLPASEEGSGRGRRITFTLPTGAFAWTFSPDGLLLEATDTVDPDRPYAAIARWVEVDGERVYDVAG